MYSPLLYGILTAIFVRQAVADAALVFDNKGYNTGKYGVQPNQSYHSSDIVSPLWQINKWDTDATDETPYIFLGLWSPLGGHAGPMIYRTDDLSLVYAEPNWPSAHNTHVQSFEGADYMVFYEGIEADGHSSGNCLLYDTSYRLAYNITSRNVTDTVDMHECKLTPDGTVMVTVYEMIDYDLSSFGGDKHDKLLDSVAQEIDIETGNLLWTWRASDHYDLADSYQKFNVTKESWDFFHINSIDKTAEGNYLISSRHMHAIIYVDEKGEIIWQLGGRRNYFEDVSDGHAIDFAWQHHARFGNEARTQLTFFDNHNLTSTVGCIVNCSRGRHLELDYDDMTVRLVQEYFHPEGLVSTAMGGYHATPNGNVLIGWGWKPTFTEHTPDGNCVLDVQFNTWYPDTDGRGHYRAFKMDWKGFPHWDPNIATSSSVPDGLKVYVSWNGATEIVSWHLLVGNTTGTVTYPFKNVPRAGFETEISLGPDSNFRYVRATAVDAEGTVLGMTGIVDLITGKVVVFDDAGGL